jgi:ubiquitin-conjugating enzyme E2 variant
MLFVWLVVPIEATALGYLFAKFSLLLCLAVFLTNQFHKWAHTEDPTSPAAWLQERGLILSQEHHDVHHESPYDTYYCITVGVWNPLLDRLRFFERTERLIRRVVPGTPQLRAEREGDLNDL